MFTVELSFEQYNTILTAIKKEIQNTTGNETAQELLNSALSAIREAKKI